MAGMKPGDDETGNGNVWWISGKISESATIAA
jgi:hypothetical protein